MIMRGQTPRALTWLGVLGVLAVAGVLLPLVPSWAQQPAGTDQGDSAGQGADKARAELEKQKQQILQQAQELQRLRAAGYPYSRAYENIGAGDAEVTDSICSIVLIAFHLHAHHDIAGKKSGKKKVYIKKKSGEKKVYIKINIKNFNYFYI